MLLVFTTTQGTAIASSDFIAQSVVEYTILPGDLFVNIPVVVIGDLINEPQEAFTGKIVIVDKNGQQISLGTDTATGTINDDDNAVISITNFEVNEDVGTATFTVSSDHIIQDAVTVAFATSDIEAEAGLDYTTVATTLNFGGGANGPHNVEITIADDDWNEPSETLKATLSGLSAASQNIVLDGLQPTLEAIGTINDNDAITIEIDDVAVDENVGTATFKVKLNGKIQDALTVDYTTNDRIVVYPALNGSDYTTKSGNVTFAAGSVDGATLAIAIAILDDNIVEPQETYTVDLSNIVGTGVRSFVFDGNQALGTINDDDAMTISLAGFNITETEGTETDNYVITSNIVAQEDITVNFTIVNSGTSATEDYTAPTVSRILTAGLTSWNIPIDILGDVICEREESFTGTIAITQLNGQQVTITGGRESASTIITDNDPISIELVCFTVEETDGTQTQNFVANMSTTAEHDIVLNFSTTDIDTQVGNDFTAQSGTLVTISAGTNTKNIPVSIFGDFILEPEETFRGTITENDFNSQDVTIINAGTIVSTITDDDASAVTIADNNGVENGGAITVTATLDNAVQGGFTVDVTSVDGTATIGDSDYTAIAGQTLTFAGTAGETQTFTLTPTVDSKLEANETCNFHSG